MSAHDKKSRAGLRAFGGFAVLVAIVGAVFVLAQRNSQAGATTDATSTDVTSAGDSTQVANLDSAATDSLQAPQKRSFFSFLGASNSKKDKDEEADMPEITAVPVELTLLQREDVPSSFTGTATVEAARFDPGQDRWNSQKNPR